MCTIGKTGSVLGDDYVLVHTLDIRGQLVGSLNSLPCKAAAILLSSCASDLSPRSTFTKLASKVKLPAAQVTSAALDMLVDRHVWALGPFLALTNLRLRDCQLGTSAGPSCSSASASCVSCSKINILTYRVPSQESSTACRWHPTCCSACSGWTLGRMQAWHCWALSGRRRTCKACCSRSAGWSFWRWTTAVRLCSLLKYPAAAGRACGN